MLLASPVPTQMTSGSEGATATAPTPPVPTESKIWVQETPALVLSQTPPVAAPAKKTVPHWPEAFRAAAMAEIRPPMRAGPTFRKARAWARVESGWGWGDWAAAGENAATTAPIAQAALVYATGRRVGGIKRGMIGVGKKANVLERGVWPNRWPSPI